MLARKLDVLDLCKMFGWANPKQAMVYYNPTASQIVRITIEVIIFVAHLALLTEINTSLKSQRPITGRSRIADLV